MIVYLGTTKIISFWKDLRAGDSRAQFFSLVPPPGLQELMTKANPRFRRQLPPGCLRVDFGSWVVPCRPILRHSPGHLPEVRALLGHRLRGSSSRFACSSCRRCLNLLRDRYCPDQTLNSPLIFKLINKRLANGGSI